MAKTDRRGFCKNILAGTFGLGVAASGARLFAAESAASGAKGDGKTYPLPAKKSPDLNSKINVAYIGLGGRGRALLNQLSANENVCSVMLCEVDDNSGAAAYRAHPDIPRISDYRIMFDKFGKNIDAVVIATPDHSHYPIASWAMACGKNVYVEKPMTRTIWESRELTKLAAKTGVVTQLGNQGHSMNGWKDVKEWYDAGVLGEVRDVYIWTDRPIWNQGPYPRPDASEKIPNTLDFDLWLNVAPKNTVYSKLYLPFHWRGFRDFGTGAFGDHACHAFDWIYSSLNLGYPSCVRGNSSEYSEFGWPKKTAIDYVFTPADGRKSITLHWLDGSVKPRGLRNIPQEVIDKTPNASAIVGSKESVICFDQYGKGTMISPRERMVELKKSGALPAPTLPRYKQSHSAIWIDACLCGGKATSDIPSYAGALNEIVLMGTLPIFFPNADLKFDSKTGLFDNPEVNGFFNSRYQYRKEFLI